MGDLTILADMKAMLQTSVVKALFNGIKKKRVTRLITSKSNNLKKEKPGLQSTAAKKLQ